MAVGGFGFLKSVILMPDDEVSDKRCEAGEFLIDEFADWFCEVSGCFSLVV